jgi:hypothetical protein
MASLRVMNGSGDQQVSWSTTELANGDPEAQAAVREAERIFERERARGAVAFRVGPGAPAEKLEVLNPLAEEEVVLIPQVVGG